MHATKLVNGNLHVPFGAYAADGTLGDGMTEVSPGSREYEEWLPFVAEEDDAPNVPQAAPCRGCVHLDRGSQGVPTCTAFPAGIPDAILFGGHNHQTPFRGDRGVHYTPIDAWEAYELGRASTGYDFRSAILDAIFPQSLSELEVGWEVFPPARLAEDPSSGLKYLLITEDPVEVQKVLLAQALYRVMGVRSPNSKVYREGEQTLLAVEFPPGSMLLRDWLMTADTDEIEQMLARLREAFVASALLGNTHLAGDEETGEGTLIAVDREGIPWLLHPHHCLGAKGSEWAEYPVEFWTLEDPAADAHTAALLSGTTEGEKITQIERVELRRPILLEEIPDPAVRETFAARLDALLLWLLERSRDGDS